MRFFKIYNKNVTKTQPLKELSEDQFLAEIGYYCYDEIDHDLEAYINADDALERLFDFFLLLANRSEGLDTGDYYLYIADDSKTVLDFNRKNA